MMFISKVRTVSVGPRISLKSMNPMMIGCSLKKSNASYKDRLLMKQEKRAKIMKVWTCSLVSLFQIRICRSKYLGNDKHPRNMTEAPVAKLVT